MMYSQRMSSGPELRMTSAMLSPVAQISLGSRESGVGMV